MSVAGPDDEFFAYTTQLSSESCAFVLDDLESYLEEEGPFDGVWGFSEGACLAAMLLIRQRRRHEERARALGHSAPPPFKPLVRCAVFFSAPTPPDPMALGRVDKEREPLDPKSAGEPIRIPTAHIWGKEDRKFIGSGMTKLCQTDGRRVFIHGRGHEIPNGRDPWSLNATLEAISKTIEAASQSPRGL
ncbi:hypothetical protein MMC10_005933 [Thelotrema lepadinum]|nr:hypothetical protein [Thelotrema lepadinum]